jgi:hypothetical protein
VRSVRETVLLCCKTRRAISFTPKAVFARDKVFKSSIALSIAVPFSILGWVRVSATSFAFVFAMVSPAPSNFLARV